MIGSEIFAAGLLAQAEVDAAVQATGYEGLTRTILFGYLLLLLAIGYWGYRSSKGSEEDYYLAGRQQGWIVSSLTILATFFSSFALLGAPGLVYKEGVVFALYALNVPIGGAVIYLIGSRIARAGRERGYVTPADMISDYYDSGITLRLLTALVCFLYAIPYVVMQINAGGILSAVLFPESKHAFEIGAICLALITMLYIMVGGMRSVAWTDVIQGVWLLGGMLIAGAATVFALGGVSGFLQKVSELPPPSLSVPGTTGSWRPEKLFTVVVFSSVGSMIQPAQWMRYYAARSSDTLRRSALVFATVLPVCYFLGVMLVGLGGQALYPLRTDGPVALPHESVGESPRDFDRVLVVTLSDNLPEMLGPMGAALGILIIVAIMAASMSTADSNLHALSAVITRDIYDRYIRPKATDRERTWVGRAVIAAATFLALALIFIGRTSPDFNPVGLIAQMGFLAIAFSTQLVPLTVDMLFVRRGSLAGATAGVITGLALVFLFTPFFGMVASPDLKSVVGNLRQLVDIGALGLAGNVTVFALVSLVTRKPRPLPPRVAE